MFRAIYSYLFGDSETYFSQDEARAILNTIGNDCQEKSPPTEEIQEENSTLHKVGFITSKKDHTYTIDNLYSYESDELNARVGEKVSYIAYISERKLHLTDVTVIDSDWDVATDNVKSSWCTRSLTVKVTGRILREITAEPGPLKINLNNVRSEFIPIVGDWLQAEAKCEIDEHISDLTGKVLEVTRIRPLRSKQTIGFVKRWDANTETGIVDRDIFVNFDALTCGYAPRIGDKVVVEVIESEQGFCNWRAVKVIPYDVSKNESETLQTEAVFKYSVEGIEITDDVSLESDKPQESFSFSFNVSNKTQSEVLLKEVSFMNKNGQCKLDNACTNRVLPPNASLKVPCTCVLRNYGRNKELLLFTFENYTLGRYINIALKAERADSSSYDKGAHSSALAAREQRHRNTKRTNVIPGQKTVATPRFIAKQIGHFAVPDKLWDLYLDFGNEFAQRHEALLKRKPCLNRLDYHCYEDYFHTLLYLEEIENTIAMRKYDQELACFITNGEYLMLEIENLAEKRPSIITGDKVLAGDPFSSAGTEFEGFVHKVGAKHIYLKFSQMFHDAYKGEDYSVRVVSSRTQMRRNHQAVSLAVRNLGRDLLFPSKIQTRTPQFRLISEEENGLKGTNNRNKAILNRLQEVVNGNKVESKLALDRPSRNFKSQKAELRRNVKIAWYDKSLNHYQKQAVRNILLAEARPLPYFIFGPPGTGKTVTLVETILQILTLLPDARVLVGTPSNSAADVVATRLIDSGALKPGDLIRFVAHKCVADDSIPLKLVPYCATADISSEGTDHLRKHRTLKNGLTLGVSCSVIGRHRVTVSTCSNLGGLFSMNFPKGHFTHIVIDEAGHLLEPETMIPLSFLDLASGQAILAGDPLQLGPVVLSKIAAECGLAESYLERLMNRFPYSRDPQGFPDSGGYDPKLVTKLVYNYRSLPDILAVPSKLFYNSELIATLSSQDSSEAKLLNSLSEILPRAENSSISSIVFHGVEGENLQTPDSPSWFNPMEASQIFLYVNDLYRLGLKADAIGIISPYVKQIQQIRAILTEAEFDMPKVGTVEEFQGQEFKVVLLSVVRSLENFVRSDVQHNLGFIFCPRRLNVAITRAQALLVVVGNPNVLAADPHWRSVLNYCIERGAYCGCPLNA